MSQSNKMEKSYKSFTNNFWIIVIMLGLFIWALVATFSLLSFGLLLWSILPSGIALCFLAAIITTAIRLRVRVDANGITAPTSFHNKQFLAWDTITDVQIECSYGKYYMLYRIKLINNITTIKLRLIGEYAPNLIKEFSKKCDKFNQKFSALLEKAETYC